DVLSLGAGLSGAEAHTARCRELVARVRRVYGGALTWTADPDRYQAVGFWGDLDYVALAGGWPLARAGDPEPGVEDLAAAWDGIKADLLAWRRKARLTAPLLLLDAGDPSPAGCEAF